MTVVADTLRTASGLCIGWFVIEEKDGESVRGA